MKEKAVDSTYLELAYLELRFTSNQIPFPLDLAPTFSVINLPFTGYYMIVI